MAPPLRIPATQGGATTPLQVTVHTSAQIGQADGSASSPLTIDRGRLPREFLRWHIQSLRDAQVLDALHTRQMRRKNCNPGRSGSAEDALWAGLCALRNRIWDMVASIRDMGCLLHVGCTLAREVQHG